MPLLKSLLCIQGFDNRTRFFTIVAVAFSIFLIFSTVFAHPAFYLVLLLIAASFSSLSAFRRARDAAQNTQPFIVGGVGYFVAGILPLFFTGGYAYIPLLMVMCFLFSLLTFPSKPSKKYILGYHGPADLTSLRKESAATSKSRIEPTFVTHASSVLPEVIYDDTEETVQEDGSLAQAEANDIGVKLRETAAQYKIQLLSAASISVIIIAIIALIPTEQSVDPETIVQEQPSITESTRVRLHALEMPDDFTLWASEHDGLIINWQADDQENGVYWQQLTTEGDDSCKEITFNNGDKIRPIEVIIEDINSYFAHFSPLDTQHLIKQIAFRGNFSLCGYKFL